MYAYDQAAWHGTDDMIARLKAAGSYERLAPTVGGWVVEGPADAPVITFFDKGEREPHAIYRATITSGGSRVANAALVGDDQDREVTPDQLALIKALRSARAQAVNQKIGLCNDRMPNTIVLPPGKAGNPTLVYFLTPQTEMNQYPLGGHWRIEVRHGSVGKPRPFTKSCIALGSGAEKNESMVLLSHSLDPTPTEIHVFTMLTSGTAVQVLTADPKPRAWIVYRTNGVIRVELDDIPLK